MLSDNGSCYRGTIHALACRRLGIRGEPAKVVDGQGTFGVFGAAWTYHHSNR